MKKVLLAAAASLVPSFALANEVADHCAAYAKEHHQDASHCACLDTAAAAHHDLAGKLDQIHSKADYEHAEAAVKTAAAACFKDAH